MKIISLVLSFDSQVFRDIEICGQLSTWANPIYVPKNVEVVWYRGSRSIFNLSVYKLIKLAGHFFGKGFVNISLLHYEKLVSNLGRSVFFESKQVLKVATPDVYRLTAPKLHRALEWLLINRVFDYLWRTNSSTYTWLPG